jgi:peptidoglycan hydrolase-like protein with peptidoglycan-binding domain
MAVLSLTIVGCKKAPKPEEVLNAETLSLNGADKLLSQSVEGNQMPASQNTNNGIVVNQDAAPLVEASVSSESVSSETPDIFMIQKALKNLGLYEGSVDGKLGPKTKMAIKEFQSQNNLRTDGKVGPKTWAVLKNSLMSVPVNEISAEIKK